jgi:hypothetical protein
MRDSCPPPHSFPFSFSSHFCIFALFFLFHPTPVPGQVVCFFVLLVSEALRRGVLGPRPGASRRATQTLIMLLLLLRMSGALTLAILIHLPVRPHDDCRKGKE